VRLLKRPIDPSFDKDTNVVAPSPGETTFCNAEEVVEGNVKLCRQNCKSVRMQSSVAPTDVGDAGPHFPAKKQQSVCWLCDHGQSNLQYVAALALVLRGTA